MAYNPKIFSKYIDVQRDLLQNSEESLNTANIQNEDDTVLAEVAADADNTPDTEE
jgi:hypothetical protein